MTSKQTTADKAQTARTERSNKNQNTPVRNLRNETVVAPVDPVKTTFTSETDAKQDKRIAYLESFHAPMPTGDTPSPQTPVEIEAIRVDTNAMVNLVRGAINEATPHVWTIGEIETVEAGFTAVKKVI